MSKPQRREITFITGMRFGDRGLRRLDQMVSTCLAEGSLSTDACVGLLEKIPLSEKERILDWIETVVGARGRDIADWMQRLVCHVADQRSVDPRTIIASVCATGTARKHLIPAQFM